jgi:hypothetical protein
LRGYTGGFHAPHDERGEICATVTRAARAEHKSTIVCMRDSPVPRGSVNPECPIRYPKAWPD